MGCTYSDKKEKVVNIFLSPAIKGELQQKTEDDGKVSTPNNTFVIHYTSPGG